METSESIGKITVALAKAQAKMGVAVKDRKNDHFRSEYATLASVLDAVRGPLASEGIAFVQPASGVDADGCVVVTTRLLHAGEWLSSVLRGRPVKTDPQSIGSAITYFRRYGLMSMCGIAPDDDDGNAASVEVAPPPRKTTPAPDPEPEPEPDPIDEKGHRASFARDQSRFCARLKELGTTYDEIAEMLVSLGSVRPSAMTQDQRDAVLARLKTPEGRAKLETYQHEVAERAAIQGEGQ